MALSPSALSRQQFRVCQFFQQLVYDPARFVHPGWNRVTRDPGPVKLLRGQVDCARHFLLSALYEAGESALAARLFEA
jgi:hypothetical protein